MVPEVTATASSNHLQMALATLDYCNICPNISILLQLLAILKSCTVHLSYPRYIVRVYTRRLRLTTQVSSRQFAASFLEQRTLELCNIQALCILSNISAQFHLTFATCSVNKRSIRSSTWVYIDVRPIFSVSYSAARITFFRSFNSVHSSSNLAIQPLLNQYYRYPISRP